MRPNDKSRAELIKTLKVYFHSEYGVFLRDSHMITLYSHMFLNLKHSRVVAIYSNEMGAGRRGEKERKGGRERGMEGEGERERERLDVASSGKIIISFIELTPVIINTLSH